MKTKVLLVGEACQSPGSPPLRGRPGRFLASLVGLTEDELFRLCRAVNLLGPQPSQPGGKGRTFDADEARRAAAELARPERGKLVLLGRRVAKAFGFARPEPAWTEGRFACVPHPSGIVLWWNDPKNREMAGRVLRRALGLED